MCHSPFKKWISFLYLRLGRLPPWPSWEDVKASMAERFRANYPYTFVVLDATELCTEIRSCLALQSHLHSSYKSRTTLNDLIGISPNGSIYFVSELWSGSISDRELVIKSVVFCLSKIFLSSHSQAVLPFNFFFFYFLSSFICCLLIRMIASQASGFVFQKKKFQSSHSQALFSFNPPFFLTSFVFADSDSWFTSITFSFKKLFSSHSRALLLFFTFLFQRHLRFFGKWFVIS